MTSRPRLRGQLGANHFHKGVDFLVLKVQWLGQADVEFLISLLSPIFLPTKQQFPVVQEGKSHKRAVDPPRHLDHQQSTNKRHTQCALPQLTMRWTLHSPILLRIRPALLQQREFPSYRSTRVGPQGLARVHPSTDMRTHVRPGPGEFFPLDTEATRTRNVHMSGKAPFTMLHLPLPPRTIPWRNRSLSLLLCTKSMHIPPQAHPNQLHVHIHHPHTHIHVPMHEFSHPSQHVCAALQQWCPQTKTYMYHNTRALQHGHTPTCMHLQTSISQQMWIHGCRDRKEGSRQRNATVRVQVAKAGRWWWWFGLGLSWLVLLAAGDAGAPTV